MTLIPKLNIKPDKKFSAWVRSFGVCIARGTWGHDCCEGVDACHVTTGKKLGFNIKTPRHQVPMCRIHHSIQSAQGEEAFYEPMGGVDRAVELASDLSATYDEDDRDTKGRILIARFR